MSCRRTERDTKTRTSRITSGGKTEDERLGSQEPPFADKLGQAEIHDANITNIYGHYVKNTRVSVSAISVASCKNFPAPR